MKSQRVFFPSFSSSSNSFRSLCCVWIEEMTCKKGQVNTNHINVQSSKHYYGDKMTKITEYNMSRGTIQPKTTTTKKKNRTQRNK